MVYTPSGRPKDLNTLGLLGYLIVANKQIHNYQIDALVDYLTEIGLSLDDTILNNILDGRDDAISFATSFAAFKNEDIAIKKDIYYMMIILSMVDNSFDRDEGNFICNIFSELELSASDEENLRLMAMEEASAIRNKKNTLFVRSKYEKPQKINWFQKIVLWIIGFFQSFFKKKEEPSTDKDEDKYKTAIEECAVIATEDFEFLKPIYSSVLDSCENTMNEIKEYRRGLSLETGYSAEVAKVIDTFVAKLNEEVKYQFENAQKSLIKKERTVSDFTISLVGRTKAGKSTLHAVLTNQGKDKIGAGCQRTTRYNRVYQWNLLRLIDTPGIGSAEASGRTDDEIAESVLGESDVICLLVVDDSILDDILEFIKKIALLNKPIIILLNHKENIRPDVKFKRFINNPREWIDTTGEANLNGHINRIQNYVNTEGFGSLIKVFPVFLLSALMSTEEKYAENSDLLWENSNIELFIDQLKTWITKYGTIKRSQTILDESIQLLNRSNNIIDDAKKELLDKRENLHEQRNAKVESLKKAETEVCEQIKDFLIYRYNQLATQDAYRFAEAEYNNKGDFSNLWNNYVKRIGFEEEIKESISQYVNIYQEKAADTITSVFEDLYFSIQNTIVNKNIDLPIMFDFRIAARMLGGIIGGIGSILLIVISASNPIGWVMTVAGAALELGASLFSSKEKKRQKAISKIYEAVSKCINEQSPSAINRIITDVKSCLAEATCGIDYMFADLEDGFERVAALAQQLNDSYLIQRDLLSCRYGFRLVDFILKQEEKNYALSADDIVEVDRSCIGEINIKVCSLAEAIEGYSLDGIIAEKITVKGYMENDGK